MSRSPISGQKDVPVYPLHRVQDIPSSVTSTPIPPINTALPQSVNWQAPSRRRLEQLLGPWITDIMSNSGRIQSYRNGNHLLNEVGQEKWKSAPDSEPCQLACETLLSRRKSDTLKQRDELNENDKMVQLEWHFPWAIRLRYTHPKRRLQAFRTIDHEKGTSNASVSQPTEQALEKKCFYDHLPLQLNPTSV